MRNNKKREIREWMFVDRMPNGETDFLGIHRNDYKAARRIIRRQQNKNQANKTFAALMAQMGIPTDSNYSAIIKGLPASELVLLLKVGNRVARLAEAAKTRLEREYQATQISRLGKREHHGVESTPLTMLSDDKLLWVHDLWMKKNSSNICYTSTEIENRGLNSKVKRA